MQVGILALSCACLGMSEGQLAAEELPGPEAFAHMSDFVGDWHFSGVASSGISGVEPGERFIARQSVRWAVPMKELAIEWHIHTDSGKEFSSGRSRLRWDEIAGAILNTYAGEDGGRSFRGVATLIGMNGNDFDWRGHESSGTGESLNYETTYELTDSDHWQVDFIPTCADDTIIEPLRFVWERTNEFKRSLDGFAGLVGKWSRLYQDASGATVISTLNVAWGPGDRSLLMAKRNDVDGKETFVGAEILFQDPVSKRIHSRFVGATGFTGDGRFEFDSAEGKQFAMNRFAGANAQGEEIVCLYRIDLQEDSLTLRCLELAVNGESVSDTELDSMTESYRRVE